MRNLSSAFKVGLLLILALVGGWYVYRVVVQRAGGPNGYHVYAYFRDATGLVPRSRITIAGIPVGNIDRIRLENGFARVDMTINRDVQLWEDATVSRRSSGLLGEYLLVIAPGTTDTRRVQDGERIRVLQEGTSSDDILNNVNAIAVRVRAIAERASEVFGTDEGRRQMADTLRNLQQTTAELNHTVHANSEALTHALRNVDELTGRINLLTARASPGIEQIVRNAREASENVRLASGSVRDVTARADRIVANNQDGINATLADLRDTMGNARAASGDLRETLTHVNSITASVDRGEGTVGRLLRDDALIDEIQGTAEGLNDVIGPIGRLRTIVGLRSEYNMLGGGLKSYIEIRLQARENQYIMFQLVDDTRGLTQRESEVITSTNPNEPHTYRRTVERTVDAFRISLQLARRLGPLTFRFGILESTGGIGLDLHLFRDRLEMRADVFDFSTSQWPRVRLALQGEIMRHFWLVGGVDDILNGPRFDFFIGAMTRFDMDDLRSLLLIGGGLVGAAAN